MIMTNITHDAPVTVTADSTNITMAMLLQT